MIIVHNNLYLNGGVSAGRERERAMELARGVCVLKGKSVNWAIDALCGLGVLRMLGLTHEEIRKALTN